MRALALTALCAVVYATGLTSQGLTNWQESTRALVAREMQRSGEYLAPTMRGEPYIAKPPMIYWAQIALARLTGDEVGEWHLRAVVALTGMLGVLATYFVGRRMFRDGLDPSSAERAAWWSALGLAVSVLYVRSSRTGELDILLVPITVVGVGAAHAAWKFAEERGRTHIGAVLLCAACAILAALSKGPPALVCLGAAMVLGPMIAASRVGSMTMGRRMMAGMAAALVVIGAVFVMYRVELDETIGLMVLIVASFWVGASLAVLVDRAVFRAWFSVMGRLHPAGVLGAAAIALWAWGWSLRRAFGADYVAEIASREVGNNLHVLMPDAIQKNLGFVVYGSAPIVLATAAGLILLVRERPRLSRSMCLILAWMVGGFLVFSVMGKGVARYLTPIWPACAMLGGWFIARWFEAIRGAVVRRRIAGVMLAVLVVAGGVQAWWYGIGRRAYYGERSVRAMALELRSRGDAGIVTWKFEDPALDLYLDRAIPVFGDGDGGAAALARHIERHGAVLMLVREQNERVTDRYGSAFDEIAAAGLVWREVAVSAAYVRPPGRTAVRVYEVSGFDSGFDARDSDANR